MSGHKSKKSGIPSKSESITKVSGQPSSSWKPLKVSASNGHLSCKSKIPSPS